MRIPFAIAAGTLFMAAALLSGCRGLVASEPPRLADPPRLLAAGTPAELDAAVDAARVVCVGEIHDQRPHHDVQYDVLARMAARPGPLLLGMEMFQRPVQQHLDDYVAGKIDLLEMLRRTGYYSNEGWKYDHTFFSPMWRLCRERGIRIVALNPDGAINRKVGRQGLDALSPEERKGIAADVDLMNWVHRERVLAVFMGGAHRMPPDRLELLYEAMTVWDETMAESAVRALDQAGPDSRMLIVAGSQHVQEYTGVPGRITRRMPGVDPLTVICRTVGQVEDDLAPQNLGHFVVLTPPDGVPEAPRLGVGLDDKMKVTEVAADGLAARHGIGVGSVLRRASVPSGDLVELRDTTDLKYALAESNVRGGSILLYGDRPDGKPFAITVDLRPRPAPAAPAAPAAKP
jgi:uncharacterized iron-regulated protein